MFSPYYKEATIKTTIINVDGIYVPDLPIIPNMCLVFCNGNNYYSYQIPSSENGKDCICHIIYAASKENLITTLTGFLGRGFETTQDQRYIDIIGSADPVWEFLKQDYQDI